MVNQSAQGAITIRRIRKGKTLYGVFDTGVNQLAQVYDKESGVCTPDWTATPATRPVITPRILAHQGGEAVISSVQWLYKGVALNFGSNGLSTNFDGAFKRGTDNSLTIMKNLANADDLTNQLLTFRCTATLDGVDYGFEKTVEVFIQLGGASSYIGTISCDNVYLTNDPSGNSANIKAALSLSGKVVDPSKYTVTWHKGGVDTPALLDTKWQNKASVNVTRDDVDGTTTFTAAFHINGEVVDSASVQITDGDDLYAVDLAYVDASKTDLGYNGDTDGVTLRAYVVNVKTKARISDDATWAITAHDPADMRQIGNTFTTPTVTITEAMSNQTQAQKDVQLIAEATFNAF